MRLLLIILVLSVLAAACDSTAMPTLPPITVVITAVDDTEALNDAVAQALTETAQVNIYATETVLALGGITLTPSLTPTLTPTQPPRPTRESTPTATFTPSITPTPTFAPYLTNTPAGVPAETPGWVRVIHAWPGTELGPASSFDVSINGEIIALSLSPGGQTSFRQVTPGAVEVALREVRPGATEIVEAITPPKFNHVIQVSAGENVSVILMESGLDAKLVTVREDASPLPNGMSRLTIFQANPQLFPALVVMPDLRRTLATSLKPDEVIGPLDIPSGSNYLVDLYDAANPGALLTSLPPLTLANRVSYLLVLAPPVGDEITRMYLFDSSTRLLPGEVHARFVNVATDAGALQIRLNDQLQFDPLPVGISDIVPLSTQGSTLVVLYESSGQTAHLSALGPWSNADEQSSDKIVLLYDTPGDTFNVGVSVFSLNAPRSAINANVRLVHGLPGVIPLELQMRPLRPQAAVTPVGQVPTATPIGGEENPWVKVAEAAFKGVSPYVARGPQAYDVRVVLSGTRNVIAEMPKVQLLPGATYDFVVLPGREVNSAQLALVQPRAQAAAEQGNPEAIAEAVAATLTAVAPVNTATPTRISSPTPTRTPLPTNTPRPSNTPEFPPPALMVDPAPPNTARGSILLSGQGFLPNRTYSIFFDNALEAAQTGVTNADGTVLVVVNLPVNLTPGLHTVRLCAGTCPGSGREAVAVVNIAPPNLTPTATQQP